MYFRLLLSNVFLMWTGMILAQSVGDSLVRASDLVFRSEYEKTAFMAHNKKADRLLSLFLSANEKATVDIQKNAGGKIAELVGELKPRIEGSKVPAKAIKLIYTTVHEKMLKKYEPQNNFSEIFSTGNYNCVSASALYGLVLTGLDIPFTIKETPSHVYLVTYPQAEKIIIETTNPSGGYLQLNEAFREDYLNRLGRAKVISKTELEKTPKNDLFNKYFFREEDDIDLFKLSGLQYYNAGIYAYEKNPKEAYQNFAKAYWLYPDTRIAYLIENSLRQIIHNAQYSQWENVEFYTKLARFNHDTTETIPRKQLLGEFEKMTHSQLIDKSDTKLYEKSYRYIHQQVKDTTLLHDIDFLYHYETVRIAANAGKTEGVEENMAALYRIKPQNADVQSLIRNIILRKATKAPDSKTILERLQAYTQKYTFLTDDSQAATLQAYCYLDLAGQSYNQSNLAKGDANRMVFEKIAKEKSLEIEGNQIARTYLEGSSAYFRAGNIVKSKLIVQKGLELAPGNYMLQNRLSQIR
jgi:hypothetical protein